MGKLLLYLSLVFLPAVCPLLGQQTPLFHTAVDLVNITAVIRSADGQLVKDLTKEDFEVMEDGTPQRIQFFARQTELPLSLGLIVDVSGSQEKFLERHNRDVATFVDAVLRPSDQVFAVCFGDNLYLVSDETGSGSAIVDGLERFRKHAGHFSQIGPKEDREFGTALYDAIYFSITEKLKTQGERRRALLVFSDGEENASEHDLLDVIETAQSADVLIYCIRYTEAKHGRLSAKNRYGIGVMKHLSMLTGGADFDALGSPLQNVFAQIGNELRASYQIAYLSTNSHTHDGSFRKVNVICNQPGTTVRAKSGYYAR